MLAEEMADFKAYLDELEQDFTVDTTKLKDVTDHFVQELEKGSISSSQK